MSSFQHTFLALKNIYLCMIHAIRRELKHILYEKSQEYFPKQSVIHPIDLVKKLTMLVL